MTMFQTAADRFFPVAQYIRRHYQRVHVLSQSFSMHQQYRSAFVAHFPQRTVSHCNCRLDARDVIQLYLRSFDVAHRWCVSDRRD